MPEMLCNGDAFLFSKQCWHFHLLESGKSSPHFHRVGGTTGPVCLSLCFTLNGQRCSLALQSHKGQSRVQSALFSHIQPDAQVVIIVILISKLMPCGQEEAGRNNIGTLQPAVQSCLSSCSLANRPSLWPASLALGFQGGLKQNPCSLTVKRGQQCW